MKVFSMIISLLTVLVFSINGQNTEIEALLDKQETRKAIYNAIAGDQQLMMDFMKVAKEHEQAAMMMRKAENHQMKKMDSKEGGKREMNDEHQMMGMMKNNPEMMENMMKNMIEMAEKDSELRNQMVNIWIEHPEMMKMCMQKMKEKGMMDADGKMMNMEDKSNRHHKH